MPDANDITLSIREAGLADLDTIVEFNRLLALETESRVLDPALLVPGVRRLLEHPVHGVYFIAERAGQVVGQLMLTHEWSDWRCGEFWWIQSVYVQAAHRRSGVFRALYQHLLRLARERVDVCGLRLYVEHDNARAQATYLDQGMQMTEYRVMEVDFRQQ